MNIFCYLWHEGKAKGKSCDTALCTFQFSKRLHADGVKEIPLLTGRCAGQNSNYMVLIMLSLALHVFLFLESTMNYLITGH